MKNKKKRFDYFECLSAMSQLALDEAILLKQTFEQFDEQTLQQNRVKMHELEHGCDQLKHEMTSNLIKEFLPPVDREDLFALSHVADELTDKVESVLIFMYMANITSLRQDTSNFVDLAIECCQNVLELMQEFKNFKKPEKLKEYIIKINDLEEQGDRLYTDAVRALSCQEADTRTVIEWRDVYHNFELCFDAAEKIADAIESIIMKNA